MVQADQFPNYGDCVHVSWQATVMKNLFVEDLRVIAAGLPSDPQEWPHIPCPTCKRSGLLVDSLAEEESPLSKSQQAGGFDWDPSYIHGKFHAVLKCPKSKCETVRLVGTTGHWETEKYGWDQYYEPLFFLPELPLIQDFGTCPLSVRDRIEAASAVLWVDPSSAANRLRAAVEELMNHHRVPRMGINKKNDEFRLSLASRIEQFSANRPDLSDVVDPLTAIRWLGNAGSHDTVLKVSDALDAVEILTHIIHRLYDTSGEMLIKKVEDVNARRGMPMSRSLDSPPF
ncbi:hypothetical protein EES37_37850 [Streptomyces sp. ADI91-18]|nr:hypothetical protein EES37_37850 [Streptomyces sp. ADI91-18]